MSFSVKQLDGEPVVLITLDDTVDRVDIIKAYLQSVELAKIIPGPVNRIIDLRRAPHCYPNIIAAVQDIAACLVGAAVWPQMVITFVGTPEMLTGYYTPNITFVSDMDIALEHIVQQ